jgi:hypothetical protein
MGVGRIPILAREEAQKVISQIVSYEQGSGGAQWEILLVTDLNDTFHFEAPASGLKTRLPQLFPPSKFSGAVLRMAESPAITPGQNQSGLPAGQQYGERFLEGLKGDLFTTDLAEQPTNRSRLPPLIAITCLNGYLQAPIRAAWPNTC